MNATSKNTGIAKINPVQRSAHELRFSPKAFNKRCAKTSAPPECSKSPPKSVPKPTTVATKPNVVPMPSCSVLKIASAGSLVNTPKTMVAMSNAIKAGSLKRNINTSKTPMLTKTACRSV